MSDPRVSPQNRVLELLADRAVFGLTAEKQAELDGSLSIASLAEREVLDRVAAAVARAGLPEMLEPLPPHLHARVLAEAPAHLPATTPQATQPRGRKLRDLASGLAIAATVLIAVGLWSYARPRPVPTAADRRNELLARANQPGADIIQLEWTVTADPAARGSSGDVVWNNATQEGYMLFRGLAANTPTREQYQLWVFDAARDERYPLDGGVFDVPAGSDTWLCPTETNLGLATDALRGDRRTPGGVVVSTRDRLPLRAKVPDRKPS